MKNKIDLTKATPRPWATDIDVETFDGARLDAVIYINHGSGKGGEICTFRHDPDDGLDNDSEEQRANAALIVKAVNEHAALVATAEAADLVCGANIRLLEAQRHSDETAIGNAMINLWSELDRLAAVRAGSEVAK